ncbi:hypothetical protein SEA_SHADOW1_57 [Mycobacterium phage Shadow1]|nr:hypothetical protein SEA_SHADOW1_57 [Mycobacterium phage Shadow1]
MSADVPLCEVCGLHPASVFDPSFAMWCAACDSVGLGAHAVKLKVGAVPPGPSPLVLSIDGETVPLTQGSLDALDEALRNGCGPDDVCTQALGAEHMHLGHYDEGTPVEVDDSDDSGDMVNHPSHYTQGPPCKGCGRPIECLDITEGMGFCLGNTVKYVWRCDLKHDAIEDLRKARVYLDREIARREAQLVADFKNRNTTKG